MNIVPQFEDVRAFAANSDHCVFPVSCEILSDITTPIEALRILKAQSSHCFLLESVAEKEKWGRYTFLGFEPTWEITCSEGQMQVGSASFHTDDPDSVLRAILRAHKSPRLPYLPTFTGGLVGYFAYDYLGYSEPAVKVPVEDNEHFKDIDLMLFDKVIAFDNFRQKIVLIVNMRLKTEVSLEDLARAALASAPASASAAADAGADANGDAAAAGAGAGVSAAAAAQVSELKPLDEVQLRAAYDAAVAELKRLCTLLRHGEKAVIEKGRLLSEVTPLFSEEQYCAMVRQAQHFIYEGDIFQIVLSNRLSADFSGSLFDTYRLLRTLNPSPYMFYFSGDVEVAGASPETLVKLENGVLHTFPLAGTRPRGQTEAEDLALEQELLADEKEIAEHNMLVDLGRNDLGKVSTFGSVSVEKFHVIERYSHVMHIGSTVRGVIRDDCDALDAISAVLPAGTLSGAPKIRACQLIGQLENNKRGIYGGAIGYIDFTGNMDTCIAIRIAYKKNGKVFVRSGAGIVADSVPETEYRECINKAKAVVKALQAAAAASSAVAGTGTGAGAGADAGVVAGVEEEEEL